MTTSRNVAKLLTDWRDKSRLSQSQAARELDVSLKTFQGWEQGRAMRYRRMLALALHGWDSLPDYAETPSQERKEEG